MALQTQVNISQAAEMVGVTRATFYRHIERKGISVTKDDDGNPLVDVAELTRVYGHRVKPLDNETGKDNTPNTPLNTKVKDGSSSTDTKALEEKIKFLEELRQSDKDSNQRQIKQLESQLEYMQDSLTKAQDNQSKLTLMLEHKESEGAGDWKKAMKAVEARVANQEKENKEEKERAQKILRQNQALKKALEAEKNKSLWQRLFG
jgi:hypothetical protein